MQTIVHTGPETYEHLVDLGVEVQRVHAGMSMFANPDAAWDLWYRQNGTWRELKVGQALEVAG